MININYIIGISILTLGGIAAYISTFKNRKVYVKILNEVSTTWEDLGLTEVKEIIKHFKFHVKVMIFGWLAVQVIFRTATFTMLKSTQSMFIETAYSLLPEILFTSIVGFFYVLILMLACLLKNIDQQIQNLNQEECGDVLNTLGRLELAYAKTIEVKRDINRIFELIIAIMLMEGFYATLRQAHGVYHALYHVKQKVYKMILGTSFIMYPVSKLFAISYTGSMLKNMAMKIGRSLHAIPVNEDDTKLFMTIQHFSKLMYYYETELTIFGFFSLDSNLLFNMVASVVTYFVVLVQFDL
ncbi:uncharacterized protein [Choristoneura fumiferana]|uniref:uncharacterized protein n=1 Tax=Choristoneura fumiferana TaxID=7141 RepID=UPI003D15A3B0